MNYNNTKDFFERVIWTFVQAFLAVWVISPLPMGKVALVGAFAAGVSAVKTFVKNSL